MVTPASRSRLDDLRAMGFAGYLVKPIRETSLVEQLNLCLARTGAGEARPAGLVRPQSSELAAITPPPPELPPLALPAPKAAAATATGLKILLAEDNPVNALLIRELLRRRGHRIQEVTTGGAAVAAMENDSFDLLLTDIHMPGMDGIEAARAIRAMEERDLRPRVAIVALTADALETGKRACQEAGMDGFLTKPVDPAELEEMFLALFPSKERLPHNAAA
jgi:CheY-like chemotaxis protein